MYKLYKIKTCSIVHYVSLHIIIIFFDTVDIIFIIFWAACQKYIEYISNMKLCFQDF